MARKKKPPEHVNHERWLVSYADFITLLFAFFTTLYAISTVDAKKAGKMVFSMRQAFNVDFFPSKSAVLGGSPRAAPAVDHDDAPPPPEIAPKVVKSRGAGPGGGGGGAGGGSGKGNGGGFFDTDLLEQQRMRALARQVIDFVKDNGLTGKVGVKVEPSRGLVISLAEAAFFGSGQADLQQSSRETMDAIAEMIGSAPTAVRIEGHTDDRPIRTSKYPSNWELSTARAVNMVQLLVDEYGFSSDRLSAAGYASFRPVDTNETPEGRARNRRVDIILLNSQAEREEPSTAPPAEEEPSRASFLPSPDLDDPTAPIPEEAEPGAGW